jgi:NAD(P)-dependent dehydrogenase (short-subunit alcohol dehydrogenase family)
VGATGAHVLGNHLCYDLSMHATSRLTHSLAHDLRPHGVTVVTLSPGVAELAKEYGFVDPDRAQPTPAGAS